MSLIWPIPPLPMLCWCWNHWNHFHLFLVFLVTRHLSCTNLIIRTIIYPHISMLSYSHILSYSHSLIFPHVPRYSHTSLTGTCPVLIIFSQAPVPSSARQTVSTRKEPVAATRDGRAPSAPFDIMSARLVFLTALCIVHSM